MNKLNSKKKKEKKFIVQINNIQHFNKQAIKKRNVYKNKCKKKKKHTHIWMILNYNQLIKV